MLVQLYYFSTNALFPCLAKNFQAISLSLILELFMLSRLVLSNTVEIKEIGVAPIS
jgi:hypothetical protein